MKPRYYFLFCLAIAIASILFTKHQTTFQASLFHALKNNPALSIIENTTTADDSSLPEPSQKKADSLVPPCDQISAEELAEFPGATVLEAAEGRGPKPDETLQVRVLKTNFKDPYVRTEAVLDNNTGNVISRQEMSADHLVVSLPDGTNPQDFLNQINIPGAAMTPVTAHGPWIFTIPGTPHISSLPQYIPKGIKNGANSVCPDFILQALEQPNNADNIKQWGLDALNGGVDAIDAWPIISQAPSVIVGIIDSGVRSTHHDLFFNMWDNVHSTFGDVHGINASVCPNNGDPNDDNGHGTHCAGTIGGINQNGTGVIGIAQKIQLMACKFMDATGTGLTTDAITCIDYACNHGAKILNCSWGGYGYSLDLYNEIQYAQSKGVILVAAAGNDSNNDDQNKFYPASFRAKDPEHNHPGLDNIVGVAATTPTDELADFSNYGPNSILLGAPGLDIYSTFNTSDTSHAIASGTSMAVPYVVGALALLEAKYPNDSYNMTISRLLNSTDKIPALQGRTAAGRLNIAKALGAR